MGAHGSETRNRRAQKPQNLRRTVLTQPSHVFTLFRYNSDFIPTFRHELSIESTINIEYKLCITPRGPYSYR